MADGTPTAPAPYLVVADGMRHRIVDGSWPPGHRLPSRSVLGAEFGGWERTSYAAPRNS